MSSSFFLSSPSYKFFTQTGCNGNPTIWIVGSTYSLKNEVAYCQLPDGSWTQARDENGIIIQLKEYNKEHYTNPTYGYHYWVKVDRHDCEMIDVNNDATPDIVCAVGYEKDKNMGHNELYLTNPNTREINIVANHGMHNFKYMKSRSLATLRSYNQPNTSPKNLIFVATNGEVLSNGRSNNHRMFKTLPSAPYFQEVPGPWTNQHFAVSGKPLIVDLNSDGRDDMILYSYSKVRVYLQTSTGAWVEKTDDVVDFPTTKNWRSARLADMDNDGILDLVVTRDVSVKGGDFTGDMDMHYFLHVFKGTSPTTGFFNFRRPYYTRHLDTVGHDLEVVDLDADGKLDIYIPQREYWGCHGDTEREPDFDHVRDIVLIGDDTTGKAFTKVKMDHKLRGCASYVQKFGDHKLVLSFASSSTVGYNYLLEW